MCLVYFIATPAAALAATGRGKIKKNPSASDGFWPTALAAFLERPQAERSNRR
jgi:hypothetical protein